MLTLPYCVLREEQNRKMSIYPFPRLNRLAVTYTDISHR